MSKVCVIQANEAQKPVIANLVQLYLYDMTDNDPWAIGADGRYQYDLLDRFWQHPYLIYCGEHIAGFALVINNCPITNTPACHFMAEFFILKSYRRKGVGQTAAKEILAKHRGPWHVGVIDKNKAATAFWHQCLTAQQKPEQETVRVQLEGESWQIFKITS